MFVEIKLQSPGRLQALHAKHGIRFARMSARKRKRQEMLEKEKAIESNRKLEEQEAHERMVKRLKVMPPGPERDALIFSLTGRMPETSSEFSPDKCKDCNVDYVYNQRTSMFRCPNCHVTVDDLTSSLERNETAQRHSAKTTAKKPSTNKVNTSVFRKFLYQYYTGAQRPPEEVYSMVRRNEFKRHIFNPSLCSTTVVDTLRGKNGQGSNIKSYMSMQQRIMMEMQGQDVPQFSEDLIERMVARYEIVMNLLYKQADARKKAPNYTLLTKKFLLLEGEFEENEKLSVHKTRNVMVECMNLINQLCQQAQKLYPQQTWTLRQRP